VATGQGPGLISTTRASIPLVHAPPAGAVPPAAVPADPPPLARPAVPRGFYQRSGKRLCDLALGTLLAAALLPLMAMVALAVLLTSGPPVLYASERIGRDGRRFRMWKFRTMVTDADEEYERWKQTQPHLASALATHWKLPHDPRVTALGSFLRRSSLDELPQFWNVLRGEMSLVGPRPYLPREQMRPDLAAAIRSVRPGLTGPFQVGGRKGLAPRTRMEIEAGYAAECAFWRDVWYLVQTLRPLLNMDGR
jgi:exopolysaccharide production protein ExoY